MDTGFAAMQDRGRTAMGVDQYTSSHEFETLPHGGEANSWPFNARSTTLAATEPRR